MNQMSPHHALVRSSSAAAPPAAVSDSALGATRPDPNAPLPELHARLPGSTAVVAIGGNSLIRAGQSGTIPEQTANALATARSIAGLIREGLRIVVTHGNGPQVGAALLRSERASDVVYSHPLDVCGATTQGEIGDMLTRALRESLADAGLPHAVVTILTHVVVACDDPAMRHPTKPIGPFLSRADAEERQRRLGWAIVEDAGRGYRRVVPSPEPIEIVELDVIRLLLAEEVVVVAAGGGGIPVTRENGTLRGVEAVIDKDHASALLARGLRADRLIISTDADAVYVDFRLPTQQSLRSVTADQLRSYHEARQFPPGSMGPKIDASLRFLEDGGREVIITSPGLLTDALRGLAGTRIVR